MARRSGLNSFLLQGYGLVNILEVNSVMEASCVRISKVVERRCKESTTRRSGLNSFLVVGYGVVNILEVAGAFPAL